MNNKNNSISDVRSRQDPYIKRYKMEPGEAVITDHAKTTGGIDTDPFHGYVIPGSKDYGVVWPFGIHQALGGYHDAPNPGDLLCAALASCLDSTIRLIAERLRIKLTFLEVDITADVDLRGTLLVDREVPVGFQKMRCKVNLDAEDGTDPKLIQRLLKASEHSCVNMQTLLAGISIETSLNGN
jgi:uncharacterized OsmC-like protein